jgi:alkylated DNA nucleotide flippase Atl1
VVDLIPEGSWTSQDDLAQVIGATPEEVAHLLASGTVLPTAYRVLTRDGEIPQAAQLHQALRASDLHARLISEGVEFDGRRARREQRVPAELLAWAVVEEPTGRLAWLARGSNVEGSDLVPQWLSKGFVSLAAAQLPVVEPDATDAQLRRVVAEAYGHKS